MNTLLHIALAYVPPSEGAQPPGLEMLNTIIQWVMWGAGAILFAFFIVGLIQAGRARSNSGTADVSAPLWPLIMAIVLGAAGTIWAALT